MEDAEDLRFNINRKKRMIGYLEQELKDLEGKLYRVLHRRKYPPINDRYQQAFDMRNEGHTFADIAHSLSVTPKQARQIYLRTKQMVWRREKAGQWKGR